MAHWSLTLFDVRNCAYTDIHKFAGALEQMLGDGFDALVIRGAFPRETVANAVRRVYEPHADLERCEIPVRNLVRRAREEEALIARPPYLICRDLISSPLDQVAYFDSAQRFRSGCRRLFEPGPDFQERIEEVLRVLGSGRPVDVPRGPQGQPYAHATVRIWPAGHEIGTHCGLEILTVPGFRPVRDLIDISGQLSYFTLLQAPTSGGDLTLHNVRLSDLDAERKVDGLPFDLSVALRASEPIPLGAGDLLIFDGGRVFHRVSEVGPGPDRVTIGGFVAFSPDRSGIRYWS